MESSMSKLVDLVCFHCQKQYTLQKNRYQAKVKKGTKKFFCSSECSIAFSKAHMKENSICLCCNASFYRPKSSKTNGNTFCSSSCAATWNNKGKQKNPPKSRECKRCGTSFFRLNDDRSYLCRDCRNNKKTTKNITLVECIEKLSVKGKHPSWKTTHVRHHNAAYNRALKKLPCQKCGYSTHVELAHIKAVSSFPDSAYLEEINSSDNILVLCRNHHWEFDHGLLLLEDIPKRS